MSMYLRQIRVEPAGDGAFAFALAVNSSSCPDDSLFRAHVIDAATGKHHTFGALGFPYGADAVAGAGRAARGALAGQVKGAARACVVDLATRATIAELALPGRAHRIALDGDGTTLACVLADRVAFYAVATGAEIAAVALSTERRFQGYVAWCAAGWVVVRATGKKWGLALLDAAFGPGPEVALKGEPYTLAGASAAPIAAAGIGKTTISTIDLAATPSKRKAQSVALPPVPDRYAAVTVAIAADGGRVAAHNTGGELLHVATRGAKEVVAHGPLASVVGTVGKHEMMTSPGFAICGERVVIFDGAKVALG